MAQTFRDLIAANRRNSVLLVTCFILFTAVVAVVLALGILAYVSPETAADLDWGRSLLIGLFAAGVAFLVALMSYFAGANLVLSISGAEPLRHKDDPELFNVVEEIAIAAGIPPPKVYLIHDSAPNAFATGRDPRHAVVAITTGLRYKLTRAELQGVMAHEIAHIRNYDIRLMMLMAVLIGTIVMLADLFWQMMYATSRGSRRRDSKGDSKGGGAIVIVLMVLAILLAIIAPILAQIIQLAVSRQREYLADASAVEFTRYPLGLASALRKIDADPDVLEAANRGTAHLYIANPIKKFEARADSIFSSHPPIQERIRRLEALAGVHDPAAKLRVSRSEVPGERET